MGPRPYLSASWSLENVGDTDLSIGETAVIEVGGRKGQWRGKGKSSQEEWMVSPLVPCTLILSSLYPCWLSPLASSSASGLVTPAWRGCSPAALWLDIHLAGGKWTCCKTDHYTKGGRGRIRGIDPATRNRRSAARAGSVHVFGSAVRSRIHEGDVRAQHPVTGPVLTG